jgi:uncharacterized membrane protein
LTRVALASAAILWFAAILIAPFAIDSTHAAPATGAACVYVTGSFVCHQRPERSFSLGGRQMPVCARCAGIYAAAAAFAFGLGATWAARGWRAGGKSALAVRFGGFGPVTAARARWVAAAAALPTIVTWLLEHLGLVHLSNTTRFAAALPLGAAVMWLLLGVLGAPRVGAVSRRGLHKVE